MIKEFLETFIWLSQKILETFMPFSVFQIYSEYMIVSCAKHDSRSLSSEGS